MEHLVTALLEHRFTLVQGDGGSGKTRIAIEAALALSSDVEFRVISRASQTIIPWDKGKSKRSLIIDDAHRHPEIASVVEEAVRQGCLVLFLSRPGYEEFFSKIAHRFQHRLATFSLNSLAKSQIVEIVQEVMPESNAESKELIAGKSLGNPGLAILLSDAQLPVRASGDGILFDVADSTMELLKSSADSNQNYNLKKRVLELVVCGREVQASVPIEGFETFELCLQDMCDTGILSYDSMREFYAIKSDILCEALFRRLFCHPTTNVEAYRRAFSFRTEVAHHSYYSGLSELYQMLTQCVGPGDPRDRFKCAVEFLEESPCSEELLGHLVHVAHLFPGRVLQLVDKIISSNSEFSEYQSWQHAANILGICGKRNDSLPDCTKLFFQLFLRAQEQDGPQIPDLISLFLTQIEESCDIAVFSEVIHRVSSLRVEAPTSPSVANLVELFKQLLQMRLPTALTPKKLPPTLQSSLMKQIRKLYELIGSKSWNAVIEEVIEVLPPTQPSATVLTGIDLALLIEAVCGDTYTQHLTDRLEPSQKQPPSPVILTCREIFGPNGRPDVAVDLYRKSLTGDDVTPEQLLRQISIWADKIANRSKNQVLERVLYHSYLLNRSSWIAFLTSLRSDSEILQHLGEVFHFHPETVSLFNLSKGSAARISVIRTLGLGTTGIMDRLKPGANSLTYREGLELIGFRAQLSPTEIDTAVTAIINDCDHFHIHEMLHLINQDWLTSPERLKLAYARACKVHGITDQLTETLARTREDFRLEFLELALGHIAEQIPRCRCCTATIPVSFLDSLTTTPLPRDRQDSFSRKTIQIFSARAETDPWNFNEFACQIIGIVTDDQSLRQLISFWAQDESQSWRAVELLAVLPWSNRFKELLATVLELNPRLTPKLLGRVQIVSANDAAAFKDASRDCDNQLSPYLSLVKERIESLIADQNPWLSQFGKKLMERSTFPSGASQEYSFALT